MAKRKQLIAHLNAHANVYRDRKTGIAWVEDYRTGTGHTCHPSISETGSIRGMKQQGYWGKDDLIVKSHGFYHNIDRLVVSDDLDEIARQYCRCGGNHNIGD